MSRNASLLILSSLLSCAFPSMGWTDECSSQHARCGVSCPGVSEILMTCKNNSAYYACSHGYHPYISHCDCPSNFQPVKNKINEEVSLDLFSFRTPAFEVICVPSNKPISPLVPAPLSPKDSSPIQAPQSVTPSISKEPQNPPPPHTPQNVAPSNETPLSPPLPTPAPIPSPYVTPFDIKKPNPPHFLKNIEDLIKKNDKDVIR